MAIAIADSELKETQICETVNEMFDYMMTKVPFTNKQHVKALWRSLRTQNLIPIDPQVLDNPLDSLNSMKKYTEKNTKSRNVILTWLITVKHAYKKEFLYNETKSGLKILFDCESGTVDKALVKSWFGRFSLVPVDMNTEDSSNSLFISLQDALNRYKRRSKKDDVSFSSWETVKEEIKCKILSSPTKILHDFFPAIRDWKEFMNNEQHVLLGQPFFLFMAAETFDVIINAICYPSEENVTFYPTKPTNALIQLGIIQKNRYVCLVSKDEEKEKEDKVKNLEMTIKDLKKSIEQKDKKIEELKKEGEKNKKKIEQLNKERENLKEELAKKEREKEELIKEAEKTMTKVGIGIIQELTKQFAAKVAGFDQT